MVEFDFSQSEQQYHLFTHSPIFLSFDVSE